MESLSQNGTIATMSERNLCKESGCPGLCCQDIDLEITGAERREIFSIAQKVGTAKELLVLRQNNVKGLFYISNYRRPGLNYPNFCLLAINGPCPNKTSDGDCIKHANREHAAINFRFGSFDCNKTRKEHGLAPVFIEPVE